MLEHTLCTCSVSTIMGEYLSLCLAVQSGDVEAVREIVGGEGDGRHENTNVVNLRNDQGHTPLHLACILGNM